VYGFPELSVAQAQAVAQAQRVSNPGCYATGAIAMLHPLIKAGVLPADYAATLPAVSGYSGGGRAMMESFEAGQAPAFELYALGLGHKHLPEIMHVAGLKRTPLFVPSVGNFAQGMLVQLPLHLDSLGVSVTAEHIHAALASHYAASAAQGGSVRVMPLGGEPKLNALALNDTNLLELHVFANAAQRQALVVARLDNLGKGASGAAVQNLKLMFGLAA
jgi:N-acetyl-gamma-glutamyl-phosphate reductase